MKNSRVTFGGISEATPTSGIHEYTPKIMPEVLVQFLKKLLDESQGDSSRTS